MALLLSQNAWDQILSSTYTSAVHVPWQSTWHNLSSEGFAYNSACVNWVLKKNLHLMTQTWSIPWPLDSLNNTITIKSFEILCNLWLLWGRFFDSGLYLAAVHFLCGELFISFLQLAIEWVPVSLSPLLQTLQFSHSLRQAGHLTVWNNNIIFTY